MKKCGLLLVILLLGSCMDNYRLSNALKLAGKNRRELEKVLAHYKDSGEKYNAACFLIENMPKYYSYEGWLLDTLKYWKLTTDSFGNINHEQVVKWDRYPASIMKKIYDVDVITADYLIKNIDLAFSVWKKRPWNKNLSFDDFCELILPYRIGNETLEYWRESYYLKLAFLLDSVYTGDDIVEATNVVTRYIRKLGFQFNINFQTPHMGALFLLNNRVGKCIDQCDYMLYIMRSLGIPATTNQYLYSTETRTGHIWNVLRDTTGEYVNFGFFDAIRSKRELDERKMGKVHRVYFGLQKDKLLTLQEGTPPLFRDCFIKDVSKDYFCNEIELNMSDIKASYVYLGVFRSQCAGEGLDMAELIKGKATFYNIEPEMIYMPLVYDTYYKPAGYPFLFDGKNLHFYEPNMSIRDTVRILRKNTYFQWLKDCLSTMVGGKFEISYNRDFLSSKSFFFVNDTPLINRNVVLFPKKVVGRYVKFTAKSTVRLELAELAFMHNADSVVPISIEGDTPENNFRRLENVIDGNPLSYYRPFNKGASVIIDFGKNVCLTEMMYMPRNDDNFIRIGDMYELFYHGGKKGWISLGVKKAVDTFLIYDNMPRGALFYLHDITRGKEEQVFHIENGKQIFISNMGTQW